MIRVIDRHRGSFLSPALWVLVSSALEVAQFLGVDRVLDRLERATQSFRPDFGSDGLKLDTRYSSDLDGIGPIIISRNPERDDESCTRCPSISGSSSVRFSLFPYRHPVYLPR